MQQPLADHGLLIIEASHSYLVRHTTLGSTPLDKWSACGKTSTWRHTQHSQETHVHASSRIQTHNSSMWAAADPRPRPRSYWDQLVVNTVYKILDYSIPFLIFITHVIFQKKTHCRNYICSHPQVNGWRGTCSPGSDREIYYHLLDCGKVALFVSDPTE